MKTIQTPAARGTVVSREEWLEARKILLTEEKAFTRQRDALSRKRRELPRVRLEKGYTFDTPEGRRTLADLFEGRGQLIVYHFMFGPEWEEGCPSCSFVMDHADGAMPHLNARDTTLVAVSLAPLPRIEAFRKRMGWRFKWASSHGGDFNYDFNVSFTPESLAAGDVVYNYDRVGGSPVEDLPGASVFHKDERGDVFHTYSTYARGLDLLVGAYNFLDLTPKGRDEDRLAFSMAWVRHHDRYGEGYAVDPHAPYAPPRGSICRHCEERRGPRARCVAVRPLRPAPGARPPPGAVWRRPDGPSPAPRSRSCPSAPRVSPPTSPSARGSASPFRPRPTFARCSSRSARRRSPCWRPGACAGSSRRRRDFHPRGGPGIEASTPRRVVDLPTPRLRSPRRPNPRAIPPVIPVNHPSLPPLRASTPRSGVESPAPRLRSPRPKPRAFPPLIVVNRPSLPPRPPSRRSRDGERPA